MPATQTVADGKTVTWPHDDPSRTGWTFDGWYQGNVAYDFRRLITDNITLTARWTFGTNGWSIRPTSGPRTGNNEVRIEPPSRISFAEVTAGVSHSVALGSDGNAYTWGQNSTGQLGDGTTTGRSIPVAVTMPAGIKFTQASAGSFYSVALDRDGNIWTWGDNSQGQLGRTSSNNAIPGKVAMPAGVTGFIRVSAGSSHCMALDRDGNIWTWGNNSQGQLGRTPSTSSPASNPGKIVTAPRQTTFTDISAGNFHCMGLAADGTAWAWGSNITGELGRSTVSGADSTPAEVNTNMKFLQLAAGSNYSAGLTKNHTIYTWGSNFFGKLGRPDIPSCQEISCSTPTPGEIPGLTGVTAVSANDGHSIAFTSTTTYAWGWNRYGQLGTTTNNGSNSGVAPAPIPRPAGAPATFRYTSTSNGPFGKHTLAIGNDGNTYSFGLNNYGQLGTNTSSSGTGDYSGTAPANPKPSAVWFPWPLSVSSVTFDGVPSLTVPSKNTDGTWSVRPAAHTPGTVDVKVSWILTSRGTGTETLHYTYMPVGFRVTFDPANGETVTTQDVNEWSRASRPTDPVRSGFVFDGWFVGNAAFDFSQPITHDVTVTGKWSRPGLWTRSPASGPTSGGTSVSLNPPSGTSEKRLAGVSVGGSHSLAISSDGSVYAWGDNTKGQLGDGTHTTHTSPTGVSTPAGTVFTQASAGRDYSVALDTDGQVWTWGDNAMGQLGRGSVGGDDPAPALVSTGTTRFTQVSAGDNHALALDTNGRVWTWGDNSHGQLGGGGTGGSSGVPTIRAMPVGSPVWLAYTQIGAGGTHSLALGSNGSLYAWGDDSHGQLGDNRTGVPSVTSPILVRTPSGSDRAFTWLGLSAGTDHTLAVGTSTATGAVYAFGSDRQGQLGDGRTGVDSPLPVKPSLPSSAIACELAAGGSSSQILTTTGTLHAWGVNDKGQLGDGTSTGRTTPVTIGVPTPIGTTWTRTTIGKGHALAIGNDGTLRSWGDNTQSQLGDGTATSRFTPAMITFPILRVTGVDFGTTPGTGTARQMDGSWRTISPASRQRDGQVPLTIHWTLNGVVQPDAILDYTYIIVRCTITWDADGGSHAPSTMTVDPGTIVGRPSTDPVKANHMFDGWFEGDAAYDFTRPVEYDLTLKARWSTIGRWTISPDRGADAGGEQVRLSPPAPRGIRFMTVTTGNSTNNLAIGSDGNLYTWGNNGSGQLGRDTTITPANKPGKVNMPAGTPPGFTWTRAAANRSHSMAIGSDGNLYTWGDNTFSKLGRDTTITPANKPGKVNMPAGTPPGFTWIQAAAGNYHCMAIGSDGNLYSWGSPYGGVLGRDTTTTPYDRPGKVDTPAGTPPGFTWTQATITDNISAAIGSDGELYTWGRDLYGIFGRDTTITPAETPGKVDTPADAPTGSTWTQVIGSSSDFMAIRSDGNLYTWGREGYYNQLGRDTTSTPANKPGKVQPPAGAPDGFTWISASIGGYISTASGSDGNFYTWGNDSQHQLGRPLRPADRPGKVQPPAGTTWIRGEASFNHTIATATDGNTYTWGNNGDGQLGRDTDINGTLRPGLVPFPGQGTPTLVGFGTGQANNLTANTDGTWTITTPEHNPGPTNVRIQWTLVGEPQSDDTTNTYTYLHVGTLPKAGGTGILILILAGLLTMSGALANRQHHQEDHTPVNTSHE